MGCDSESTVYAAELKGIYLAFRFWKEAPTLNIGKLLSSPITRAP
jgi:hypothetical protein